ncbi:MAG TPA: hypothetical protein VGV39_00140 [Mesorhizobium sp.]|jgi:hypothetical protein|uniref:hypothetical protein n=1 Tax=Mesorhizobium sp. TaxID=1871066 RepID=UPI002DDD8A46|nr:hypothetical protein [Mesorhizobium sp.]HEV2501449.1 hypothetical protein [Mesorhizobium sp.]
MGVNATDFVDILDSVASAKLFALLVNGTAASELLESLEDRTAKLINDEWQLTERGTILLDLMVERAHALGRLPEEYEPDWIGDFRTDAERLQRLIAECRVDEALALLQSMVPDQGFMSPAAAKMLAQIHSGQGSLSL